MITPEHIEHFKEWGYVVIEDILTEEEVGSARNELHESIYKMTGGIRHQGENWTNLKNKAVMKSPANRMYYAHWKLHDIHMKTHLVEAYESIMEATYLPGNIPNFDHPFQIDTAVTTDAINNSSSSKSKIPTPLSSFCYIDRVCYRLPDIIHSEEGLSLHIDRNPIDPYLLTSGGLTKWRPIQGFLSLTDHYDGTSGGLKVVPAFHKIHDEYFQSHANDSHFRERCIGKRGEFFRMGGKSYCSLQKKLETVIAPKGSLVLWDWRLPHSTCAKLSGNDSREVVFTGFLPNTDINRTFVKRQWECIKNNHYPPQGPQYSHGGTVIATADRDWEIEKLTMRQRVLLGDISS